MNFRCHHRFLHFILMILSLVVPSLGSDHRLQKMISPVLPECEGHYDAPSLPSALPARTCGQIRARNYKRRHLGIGFEILDAESEACFVPDDEYQLLDQIIDEVQRKVVYEPSLSNSDERVQQALRISKTISHTLDEFGFSLAIDTVTLGDALATRDVAVAHTKHVFDCDTGSLIFLTVAENLKAPVAMVRMHLGSGNYHYWVRWLFDSTPQIEWDMNGRLQCVTPPNLPPWQGKPMTRKETLGYTLTLRGGLWEHSGRFDMAIKDYRNSIQMEPDSPIGFNAFAWLIATLQLQNRSELVQEALVDAKKAVAIAATPSHLDTLACVEALQGDFQDAKKDERKAVDGSGKAAFEKRLSGFNLNPPKDCTGALDDDE